MGPKTPLIDPSPLGQIFAKSRQGAEVIFQQCPTKVMVTLKGRRSIDKISCPLHISKTVEDLFMKFYTNIKHHQTIFSQNFEQIESVIRQCADNKKYNSSYIFTELCPFDNITMEIVLAR